MTKLVFPEKPFCAIEQIEQARAICNEKFPEWVERLRGIDADHPWLSKAQHATKSVANVRTVLEIVGINPDSENAALLKFAAEYHDLGRIVQALVDAQVIHSIKNREHGEYSVQLIAGWGIGNILGAEAYDLVCYAFDHHSDVQMPKIEVQSEKDLWRQSFTEILRISDKFATMMNRTDYYLTSEGIAGQIPLMEKECKAAGKPFHGEAGYINQEALEPFSKREPFLRSDCSTYEAYMGAFYMGWLFDIQIPEVLKVIVDSGFVEKILDYLHPRIPKEQFDLVKQTVGEYLSEYSLRSYKVHLYDH